MIFCCREWSFVWRDGWSEIEAGAGAGEGSLAWLREATRREVDAASRWIVFTRNMGKVDHTIRTGGNSRTILCFVGNVCVSLTLISLQRFFYMSQYMIFPDHLYSVQLYSTQGSLLWKTGLNKEPCEPAEGWVVEKITRAEGMWLLSTGGSGQFEWRRLPHRPSSQLSRSNQHNNESPPATRF